MTSIRDIPVDSEPSRLLNLTLQLAVPLRIAEFRQLKPCDRTDRALLAGRKIAEHGDDLQFGGKHCASTFDALVDGLACAAYVPGGIDFNGLHWEVK